MIRKWGARACRPHPPSLVQKLEHEHAPGRGHEADLERIHRVVLPLVRERSAGPVDPDARGHGAAAQPSVAFGFLLFARAALRASPSASTVMNPVIRRIR